jgi:hypothetical protein
MSAPMGSLTPLPLASSAYSPARTAACHRGSITLDGSVGETRIVACTLRVPAPSPPPGRELSATTPIAATSPASKDDATRANSACSLGSPLTTEAGRETDPCGTSVQDHCAGDPLAVDVAGERMANAQNPKAVSPTTVKAAKRTKPPARCLILRTAVSEIVCYGWLMVKDPGGRPIDHLRSLLVIVDAAVISVQPVPPATTLTEMNKIGRLRVFREEPSCGLEPQTPSLPWRCSTN